MAIFVEVNIDQVLRETEKAFLIEINEDEVWVPKSQIHEGDTPVYVGLRNATIEIAKWLAEEKSLDYSNEHRY